MRLQLKRLFRISLRTLFALMTILCLWLGLKARQVHQLRQAIKWVEGHGGQVYYYELQPTFSNMSPEPPGPRWLRDLVGQDYFITPSGTSLVDNTVSDVSQLRHLPELRQCFLCAEGLADISPLAKLQKLRALYLECHSNCDLSPLAELTQLRGLVVPDVSDERFAELKRALPHCDVRRSVSPGTSY
jgi:hypothetical protein